MEARVTVLTFGVKDLERSIRFYEEGLGWQRSRSSNEHIAFFQLANLIFALYPRHLLAEDAQISSQGSGFSGVTVAHNVRTKDEVAQVLRQAEQSGGKIVKPAQDVFWGGHSGYFRDPDDHLWEIAWNPGWVLNQDGLVRLKN